LKRKSGKKEKITALSALTFAKKKARKKLKDNKTQT